MSTYRLLGRIRFEKHVVFRPDFRCGILVTRAEAHSIQTGVAGLGDLVEQFCNVELSLGVDELLGKRPELGEQ